MIDQLAAQLKWHHYISLIVPLKTTNNNNNWSKLCHLLRSMELNVSQTWTLLPLFIINTPPVISVQMLTAVSPTKCTQIKSLHHQAPTLTAGGYDGRSCCGFKISLSFGWQRSVSCVWWICSCFLVDVLQDILMAFIVCLHSVCSLFMAWGGVMGGVGLLRRQSRTSALSTNGQWGSPPGPARSLCLRWWWSWSSHLDLSERCRCPCHGQRSQYLVRVEKTWGGQTQPLLPRKISNFGLTVEIWAQSLVLVHSI